MAAHITFSKTSEMDAGKIDSLSAREKQCLRLVRDGLGSGEIAEALGIAIPTVESHIKNARAKLGNITRRAAGRLMAEADHPQNVISQSLMTDDPPNSSDQRQALREERSDFNVNYQALPRSFDEKVQRNSDRASLSRLVLILIGLVALMTVILLVPAMADGFQRLANLVDPPTS